MNLGAHIARLERFFTVITLLYLIQFFVMNVERNLIQETIFMLFMRWYFDGSGE